MDFNLDNFLSQILYVLSGFLFGIFASLLQVCILLIAFIAFPLLFSTRTVMGSFVYYAVLLFFFSKGYNKR